MRLALSFAAGIASTLAATTALAQVVEPNGLPVPHDSSPEIQLYTLFSQRGENVNWQTDAHVTPASFSPLCGFTATYVLNQAGSHFGLAWYNDTGSPPQPSQLYQLVAPNSPVGTTFSGTVIKNDPNYKGGLVGFALVGGETHYTNSAYDTVCTACSPAAQLVERRLRIFSGLHHAEAARHIFQHWSAGNDHGLRCHVVIGAVRHDVCHHSGDCRTLRDSDQGFGVIDRGRDFGDGKR